MRSACAWALPLVFPSFALFPAQAAEPGETTLHYAVEWRLIRAGSAKLSLPAEGRASIVLESVGLVSKLYKVEDHYAATYERGFCATTATMTSSEGKRRRETKVTYDRARKKANYLERDLVKDAVVRVDEIDTPGCVHDIIGALLQLRTMKVDVGHSAQIPMSDGKKSAMVRVEAQAHEDLKTPAGTFKTTRYEVFLFGGVLYHRPARVFVWLSDDPRHLPVQIRVRLQLTIGTITLVLEKEAHS
ncbi:MAG: DUF3108 domain-containing protein [Bryobacteraceae bacterium]